MRNHRNAIKIKAVSLILTFIMVTALASCVDTSTAEDYLANYENINKVTQTTAAPTAAPTTPEGFTPMPTVDSVMRVDSQTVIIAGTCEADSTIYIEGASNLPASVQAVGTSYIAEVTLTAKSDVFVSVMAKAGELKTSEANTITVKYDGTAEKRLDGKTMVVGKDSWLFFDSEVKEFAEPTLFYESRVSTLTKTVNERISIVSKTGDAEFIFVLVPSRLTMYPDKSPVEKTTANTRYSQAVFALKNSNATVIDCQELFEKLADKAEYPLYYRTDSNWSEYAAFLAYTELMNYISGNETVLDYTKAEETEATKVLQQLPPKPSAAEDAGKGTQPEEIAVGAAPATTGTEAVTTGTASASATEPAVSYKVNGKFPSAAPLSLDAFTAVKSGGIGGDVTAYNSISRELLKEEFVRFSAKDAKLFDIGSETFAPKASGEEPTVSPTISQIQKYVSDKDNLIYAGEGKEGTAKGTNEACGFRTDRPELPSALILKDDSIAQIYDLVAERFNNCYFCENGQFEYQGARAASYAGSAGNELVDYVIYFVSEENIGEMVSGIR